MRGNNYGFAHATAFHEMIPGHNLQGYNNARYSGYRANLRADTPFLVEGWALYWELILYDKGFDKTPEEKVGAMFLADAPLRPHHLLVEVPHGAVVAAAGDRLPGRPCRP